MNRSVPHLGAKARMRIWTSSMQTLAKPKRPLNGAKGSLENGMFKDALAQAQAAEGKLGGVRDAVKVAMQKIEDWKEENKAWYLR